MKFYLLLFLFFSQNLLAQLYINEVLPISTSSKVGIENIFTDYIELYNFTDTTVSLKGFSISDGTTTHFFKNNDIIKPKGYLLCQAVGMATDGTLQLNFKLSGSGETLTLYNADSKRIDKLTYPALQANHSYGRMIDSPKTCRIFTKLSPGKPNPVDAAYKSYAKRSVKPMKSSGYYEDEIQVKFKKPLFGKYRVFYSTDGSIPLPDTLPRVFSYKNAYQKNPFDQPKNVLLNASAFSKIYTNTLKLSIPSTRKNSLSLKSSTFDTSPSYFPAYNIPKAHIIRGAAAKSNKLPKKTVTATYFKANTLKNPSDFLLTSIVLPEEDLFDYYTGIYTAGFTFDKFRKQSSTNADICTVGNFRLQGNALKRSAHVDIFNDKKLIFSTEADLSINGGCTRTFPYKALRIETKDDFSLSEFFINEKNRADRLVFRNGGNDFDETMFKDVFVAEWLRPLNFVTQEYKPNILYLNGEYWGIHEIREKIDEKFVARKYEVNPEHLDLIKIVFDGPVEVESGTDSAFVSLKTFFKNNDLTKPENYTKAQQLIDIQNFIDYQASQIFIGNIDWPQNNVRLWRKNTKLGSGAEDGRWRWIFFDADRGLGEVVNVFHDNLNDALTRPDNYIFQALYKNKSFKAAFSARFRELMATTLNPKVSVPLFLKFKEMYKPEVEEHLKRWKNIESLATWEKNCDYVKSYLENRVNVLEKQLNTYFGTGKYIEIAQKGLETGLSGVNIQKDNESYGLSQSMSQVIWTTYDDTYSLSASAPDNYTFKGWLTPEGKILDSELDLAAFSTSPDSLTVKITALFSKVENRPEVHLNQGVSPNGDGLNDDIKISLQDQQEMLSFYLQDRHGVPIKFKEEKLSKGLYRIILTQNVPSGTYFYLIKLKSNATPVEGFIEIR